MNHKKGFTLIELLVVIAIIGILASVILASLNAARDKARYAQVISQMEEISKAAQIDIAYTGVYPPDTTPAVNPGLTSMTTWPTPPCAGWTYDWDNWDASVGGTDIGLPTVRVTIRRPNQSAVYYYCIRSVDPNCAGTKEGGTDIKLAKTLTCKE
jgi:prepilin-type N-terminal cleavage/methylation domain-containing protein